MKKILHYVRQFFKLLFQGHFFLIFHRILTAVLPDRVLGTKKAVLYKMDWSRRSARRSFEGLECFRGNEGTVEEIVRDLYDGGGVAREFYMKLYRDGIEPWVARREGRIVGVIWLYTGWYLLPWEGYDAWLLNIEVEPTAKFFANGFVHPTARRLGISTILAECCFDHYPRCDFYTCIDETNFPSKISREKLGFRRCAVVYFVRIFQTTRCAFMPKAGRRRRFKLTKGRPAEVSLVGVEPPVRRSFGDGVDKMKQ